MIALMLFAAVRSTPDLGIEAARCRADETGPAVIVTAAGLKDRRGLLRAEIYPPDDSGFLADDNVLVGAGRVFRRAVISTPQSGPASLCLRVPGPGSYTLALLHDRDGNRKFGLSVDGIGFSNNPAIGLGRPSADQVRFTAGAGITRLTVRMNYRRGLLSFGPVDGGKP